MLTSYHGPEAARAGRVLIKDVMLTQPDEHVLITADTASDMTVVQALQNAAHELGAKVAVLIVPQLPHQGGFADPYIPDPLRAAMCNCDVWIELNIPYLAGSKAFDAVMKNERTRYYLSPGLTREAMIRLFTKVNLDDLFAVNAVFEALLSDAAGKECRITNKLGSDVTFKLAKEGADELSCCRAEKPGMTAVPGAVLILPELESVKGVLMIESLLHDDIYTPLEEPVTLRMDGKVQEISGGGPKLRLVETALKRGGGGDDYGYVIHFTCGIHPAARNTGECFIEDQRVTGYNAIGLGLPWWVEGGGETHPDSVLSSQSLWVDGEEIVRDGVIVGPPKLAELADRLQPG